MKEWYLNLEIEHQVLIVLYFVVYLFAMLIQIKDPKASVKFLDWILAFLASSTGAILTFFGVMSWANIGVRMTATVVVSLMSYRTLKFLVSDEAQDEFTKGFWSALKEIFSRFFNGQPPKTNNDNKNE